MRAAQRKGTGHGYKGVARKGGGVCAAHLYIAPPQMLTNLCVLQDQEEALDEIIVRVGHIKHVGMVMHGELAEQVRGSAWRGSGWAAGGQVSGSAWQGRVQRCTWRAGMPASEGVEQEQGRLPPFRHQGPELQAQLQAYAAPCSPLPARALLTVQELLLTEMNDTVDTQHLRLKGLQKRVAELLRRTKWDSQMWTIVFLTVVLVILTIAAIA